MGYDQEEVEPFAGGEEDFGSNIEKLARNPDQQLFGSHGQNPFEQKVLYVEAYMHIDYDQDGVGELLRLCCMGEGYEVKRRYACDGGSFCNILPRPGASYLLRFEHHRHPCRHPTHQVEH